MNTENNLSTESQGFNEARLADNKRLFYHKIWFRVFIACFVLVPTIFFIFQKRPTVVVGYIQGVPNGAIVISTLFLDNFQENHGRFPFQLDSVIETIDGRFRFGLPGDRTHLVRIIFRELDLKDKHYISPNKDLLFVAHSHKKISLGNKIKIRGRVVSREEGLSDVTISGSKLNRDFSAIQSQLFEINRYKSRDEDTLFQAMVIDGNREKMEIGLTQRKERDSASLGVIETFIKTNPDHPLSAFFTVHTLHEMGVSASGARMPLDSLVAYDDIIGKKARKSVFGDMYHTRMTKFIRDAKHAKAHREIVAGAEAPDFTLNDINGNPFTLSSLRGKHVILDFWWPVTDSTASRGSYIVGDTSKKIKMEDLYETYKDVVEIVSVSCVQKSIDVWQKAAKHLGKTWINVFSDSLSEVNLDYGVGSYPTNFLIDSDGKILLRTILNQTQQLSEELENIFGRGDTLQRVAVGTKAPDFMLRDINARQFRLSSLQGKYVIINFWGTWCTPCIRGIPRMKQVYERFQDKLEIVGVATREESVANWRAGVKRLELPWINVYNDNVSAIHTRYGITGYPTKLLISPDGTVLVRETGTQGSFYTRLEYILLHDDLIAR